MSKSPHTTMKRRTFLKVSGAVGGAVALGTGVTFYPGSTKATGAAEPNGQVEEYHSSCAMECLHCALVAEVQDGKIINIKGDPKFNTTPCLRGISRMQYVYSKDRILYPMKRVGERGSGKWERISWDEALDTIAAKMKEVKETVGPKGLLYVGGSGNFASLSMGIARSFFTYLGGATPTLGQLCCAAVTEVMTNVVGDRYYEFRDTLEHSRYILSWGNNPAVTNQGYFKNIVKAMDQGARLVVIDPRYNETAGKAHEWVPIKPGTDTALAMGMLNVIIRENLHDRDFLLAKTGAPFLVKGGNVLNDESGKPLVLDSATKRPVPYDSPGVTPLLSPGGGHETVFDLIAKEVATFTPEKTEEITRVPAATVLRLAREFAATKPACIMENMGGFQRTEHGTYAVLSHFYLCAFTGNFGFLGAGVNDTGGVNQLFKVPPAVPPLKADPIPGIPISKLGEWIVEEKPHKIELMYVGNASIMTQVPNSNKVREALLKVPFVVAANNRWASHTKYADIVLPVTTLWESMDVMAATRSRYVQLLDKGVEPQGEAKSDAWIWGKLAARLGFGELFDLPEEELCNNVLKPFNITVDDLRKNGPHNPFPEGWIPWKDGVFKTPTKRMHLFIPSWAEKGFSPVLAYYPPEESPEGNPELAAKYPLQLTNRKTTRSIHSTFSGGLPYINELTASENTMWIHVKDAEKRGIKDGDYVTVFNDRGKLRIKAVVTLKIMEGVVSVENGWWEHEGPSSSTLSNDTYEPLSYGHTLNSTLVQVAKEA